MFCIYSGLLKDGYDLISQALALLVRVCGILHEDACMCLRLLGRLSYLMGEYPDVSSVLGRAFVVFQSMTCYISESGQISGS